jgi:hypothetical protein
MGNIAPLLGAEALGKGRLCPSSPLPKKLVET